jgi:hypothetical protein
MDVRMLRFPLVMMPCLVPVRTDRRMRGHDYPSRHDKTGLAPETAPAGAGGRQVLSLPGGVERRGITENDRLRRVHGDQ